MLRLRLGPGEPEQEAPQEPAAPKISLNLNTPRIKVKTKAAIEGYDSEAPDKEDDPTMEEAVVLRMLEGQGLEKLREMCEKNTFEGLSIEFKDARRAVVTVDGHMYAAQLVDLPTVTEVSKTFDRKNIYKSVDISQMLLVLREIQDASDLPPLLKQYQHGISTPLYNVRNRRFHQRISNKVIELIESKVDELFKKDLAAQEVSYELVSASSIGAAPDVIVDELIEAQESEDSDEFDMIDELEKALAEPEVEEQESSGESSDSESDDDNGSRKLLREEIHELQSTIAAKERESEATVNQIMRGRLIDGVNRMKSELQMKLSMMRDLDEEEQEQQQQQQQQLEEPDEEEEEEVEAPGDAVVDGESVPATSETPKPDESTAEVLSSQVAEPESAEPEDAMDDDLDALF